MAARISLSSRTAQHERPGGSLIGAGILERGRAPHSAPQDRAADATIKSESEELAIQWHLLAHQAEQPSGAN
jgi:hypothetical protein